MEKLQQFQPTRPAPFLKWAGGKGQLLEEFEKYFPSNFETYYEPFLGGGAVFFHLVSSSRVAKAVISDSNRDLINCYAAVRDHIEELLTELARLQKFADDKKFFYQARNRFNEVKLRDAPEGNVEKAALLIYLNKTCYNGLYRVNSKGEFNVPWGRYKNPTLYVEDNVRAIHRVLKRPEVQLWCNDYAEATASADSKDFIYFDPPYQPVSTTSNFTAYTAESFVMNDQIRLARVFRNLHERRCLLMLSNSPRVEGLYEGFRTVRLKAARAISCVGSKRGPVEELLILNY